ncbi:MAG: phosphatase PAP2 family protein [Nanoarchaeota archaeon]
MHVQQKTFSRKTVILFSVLGILTIISLFYDKQIFSFIFRFKNPILDNFFVLLTNYKLVIALFYLIPCIPLLKDRKRSYIPFILGSLAISFFLGYLLKNGIERIRPLFALDITPLVVETSYSFPSTHAVIVFACLPLFWKLFPKIRYLFLSLAILVGFSRIYIGVHYLSDVLGGALLGLLVGFLILFIKDEKIGEYTVEIKRQVLHIFYGAFMVLLLHLGYINRFGVIVIIIVGLVLSFISMKRKLPLIDWFLQNFDRNDKFPGWGAITFFIGILMVLYLFPLNIALASIMILTFGDSVATLVGKLWGKMRNPLNKKKTVEGTLAGMLFGAVGAVLFVSLSAAVIASIIAMLFEAIDGTYIKINDNILVPLVAGIVMKLGPELVRIVF